MGLNGTGFHSQSSPDDAHVSGPLHRMQPWYAAYMAALFEPDRTKIVERVREAEILIVDRSRALRNGNPDIAEQRALDNALHALRALASCMKK